MKKESLKQAWVAFKIWIIALAANTLMGSIYLSGGIDRDLVIFGLIYGTIFSAPIFLILLLVIGHCVSRRKNGLVIFRYVFITGLLMTGICSILFGMLIGTIPGLLFISVLSAVIAIALQYNALFKLARYDHKYEGFLS